METSAALVDGRAPSAQPRRAIVSNGRTRIREHAWGLMASLACVALFVAVGVPFSPESIVLCLTGVVLVDATGRQGLDGAARVAIDWAPVVLILVLYDLTRGIADTLGMPLQIEALVNIEKAMFLGEVPTVWLQQRMIDDEAQWWEGLTALIYVSHFFACFVLAGWLYIRQRDRWRRFINRFLTLNVLGLLTYILVPAAPPWYASEAGVIGDAVRTSGRGFDILGLKTVGGFLAEGQRTVNHVAAMPSLHGGYSFLFAAFLWPVARRSRWLLAAYPPAMGFTLVYSGEHYVIDILAGWVFAIVVHVSWSRRELRRGSPDGSSSAGRATVTEPA